MKPQTARDVMNPNVLTVEESLPASELAAFFAEHEISGAPVLDAEGQLVGVVSLSDLARATTPSTNAVPDRSEPSFWVREWEEHYNPEDIKNLTIVGGETTVGDLMSRRRLSVTEETAVADCARKMLANHSHRVLVTAGGQLKGIITSFDLLRRVAESG